MVLSPGIPVISPKIILATYSACMSPFVLQSILTPQKYLLETFRKQQDIESEWLKASIWQTKMAGVMTLGLLCMTLGVLMPSHDTRAQVHGIGVLAALQVGILYIACRLQYTEGMLQDWHANVIYFHAFLLLFLLLGLMMLLHHGVEKTIHRRPPPGALLARAS